MDTNLEPEVCELVHLQELLLAGLPEIQWIVHGLIRERGITVLAGESGSYKSWLALYLGLCVVNGQRFLARYDVRESPVIYLDDEMGKASIYQRLKLLLNGQDNWHARRYFADFFGLYIIDSVAGLESIQAIIDKYRPGLIIIDSFVRTLAGEENSSSDVARYFRGLKGLPCAFLVLHHTCKDGRGYRGSGDIKAAPDTLINIQSLKNLPGRVRLWLEKSQNLAQSEWPDVLVDFCVLRTTDGQVDGMSPEYFSDFSAIRDSPAPARCADQLLDWVEEEKLLRFSTPEAVSELKRRGFKPWAIHAALKLLREQGQIFKETKGQYGVKNADLQTVEHEKI